MSGRPQGLPKISQEPRVAGVSGWCTQADDRRDLRASHGARTTCTRTYAPGAPRAANLQRLYAALIAEGFAPMTVRVLALTTGMRRGELLALRWRDVDLDGGSLQVTGSLVREAGQPLQVGPPKTARSRRRVELGAVAVDALRRRHATAGGSGGAFVFASSTGTPIGPSNMLRRSFAPLLKQAGLPRIRFHDLRHTAATLQLGMGTHPKVVADMLGHASGDRHSGHLLPRHPGNRPPGGRRHGPAAPGLRPRAHMATPWSPVGLPDQCGWLFPYPDPRAATTGVVGSWTSQAFAPSRTGPADGSTLTEPSASGCRQASRCASWRRGWNTQIRGRPIRTRC